MNCKPGDLAVIVRGNLPLDLPLIGQIRRVTSVGATNAWGALWDYEGNRLCDSFGRTVIRLSDSCLRPIRPDESPEESAEAMKKLHHIPSEVTA